MNPASLNDFWVTSWENLFLPYANNKGADQPAHPCSLISTFVVRCLDSRKPILAISKMSRLYLVCVDEQVGLSLTWSQTPEERFSRDEAHLWVHNVIMHMVDARVTVRVNIYWWRRTVNDEWMESWTPTVNILNIGTPWNYCFNFPEIRTRCFLHARNGKQV